MMSLVLERLFYGFLGLCICALFSVLIGSCIRVVDTNEARGRAGEYAEKLGGTVLGCSRTRSELRIACDILPAGGWYPIRIECDELGCTR